jgi:hypothetical protein
VVEIGDASRALQSGTAESQLERIPQPINVLGIALHPGSAPVYVHSSQELLLRPRLLQDCQALVGILDAHTGCLRLRVMSPEPMAMLSADSDGLHDFLPSMKMASGFSR